MSQTYTFRGLDQRGHPRSGRIVALDRSSAQLKLHRRGIEVTKLQRRQVADLASRDYALLGTRLPLREVGWIARNMAGLLNSGLPITHACELLADQRPGKRAGRVMTLIHADLEDGRSVEQAFERQSRRLGRVTTAMVVAGAATGSMAPTFQGVAKLCHMQMRLRSNLRRATIYPVVVLSLLMSIFLMMIYFIVPRFEALYAELGAPLPAATRFVIAVTATLTNQALAIPAIIILLISLIALMRQLPTGRLATDRMLLSIPRLGPIIRRSISARAAGMMGALLRSGVPMLDALELTGQSTGNAVFERAFGLVRQEIALGESVSVSFSGADELPLVMRDLTAVGDAAGDLSGVLQRYTEDVEDDLRADGEGFAKALEPFLIVGIGLLLGAIIVAMYLPMFTLTELIK
jgi:type IV pilus assembly protein PilC